MPETRTPEKTGIFPKSVSRAQAVDTGMALVLVCLLLGLFRDRPGWFLAAAALLVLNMTAPALFKPAAKVWLGLAHLLGGIMSRVLLSLVFWLVVTPVGLLRRAMGRDSLRLKQFKKDDSSVFQVRDAAFTAPDVEQPY